MKNTKKVVSRQEIQVVGFFIGSDEYALGISDVREIVAMTEIRKVPKAPKFVEGVINLRGKIVPILDLRKRFEITPAAEINQAKILIIEYNGNFLGMIVDNVSEVFRLSSEQLERTPPLLGNAIDSQYIWGVGKVENRLIILLDTEKLLSFEERNELAGLRS
ncbi:MAG: purine-binding chemotaxis protein CheW [Candidatus Riflebacteria bacterium]|nr:purine-binding chemotaxis protein CheW [Candidatus Riflebacteria bacterium]